MNPVSGNQRRPDTRWSRIDGDEFVILLPAIPSAEAATIAWRIIGRVSEALEIGEASLQLGISVGSACAPRDGITADALLRLADKAMYEAKRLGKGYFATLSALTPEIVELAAAADADARMSRPIAERPGLGTAQGNRVKEQTPNPIPRMFLALALRTRIRRSFGSADNLWEHTWRRVGSAAPISMPWTARETVHPIALGTARFPLPSRSKSL